MMSGLMSRCGIGIRPWTRRCTSSSSSCRLMASARSGCRSFSARSSIASRESDRLGRGGRPADSTPSIILKLSRNGSVGEMRILMVASEAAPFAKTGGLADVVGSLPRALARLGHRVDVVMPRYRGVTVGTPVTRLTVPLGGQVAETTVFGLTDEGRQTLFVDHSGYFDRDYLYGAVGHDYPDNPERFAFLCRAALEWAEVSGEPYDVLHGHDWQAGLLPVLQRASASPALRG